MAEVEGLIVFIEEGHSRGEVGDEHEFTMYVDIGGEYEGIVHRFEVLAFEVKPLEAAVGAVGDC